MKDSTLSGRLCGQFCQYYKPGKNEELICAGYLAVERMIQAGKLLDFDLVGIPRDSSRDETIVQRLCLDCSFYRNDCDFMTDRHLTPCGGFVVLALLLGVGRITINDI